jgi:hypothetical protein
MPVVTPTWLIPYPVGTDRFCDGDLFTQELAERVDAILDDFDALLPRLVTPPMAKIVATVAGPVWAPVTGVQSNQTVNYDSVDYDTDDMTNITFDPQKITYTRNGYWVMGGLANFNSTGTVDSVIIVQWVVGNTTATAGRAIGFQARRTATNHIEGSMLKRYSNFGVPGLGAEAQTDYNISANVATIQIAPETHMYVRWFSDL